METKAALYEEIRAMAADCAVCERDALDAEQSLSVRLELTGIAHPEDAFANDLLTHRRERHREKIMAKIRLWAATNTAEE